MCVLLYAVTAEHVQVEQRVRRLVRISGWHTKKSVHRCTPTHIHVRVHTYTHNRTCTCLEVALLLLVCVRLCLIACGGGYVMNKREVEHGLVHVKT
jgi:hypothetical protein